MPPESDADHFYLGVACDECMTTGRTDGFGAGFSGHLKAGGRLPGARVRRILASASTDDVLSMKTKISAHFEPFFGCSLRDLIIDAQT